jgi:hypothetical protein
MKIFKTLSLGIASILIATSAGAEKYWLDDDVKNVNHSVLIPYDEVFGNGGRTVAFNSNIQSFEDPGGGNYRAVDIFMYVKSSVNGKVYANFTQCGGIGDKFGEVSHCLSLSSSNNSIIGSQYLAVPNKWCEMPCDTSTPTITRDSIPLKVYDKYCAVSIRLSGGSDIELIDPYVRTNARMKQGFVAAPDAHYLWQDYRRHTKSDLKNKATDLCNGI